MYTLQFQKISNAPTTLIVFLACGNHKVIVEQELVSYIRNLKVKQTIQIGTPYIRHLTQWTLHEPEGILSLLECVNLDDCDRVAALHVNA